MTIRALPTTKHNLPIYDEDWSYLVARFGQGREHPVGPSAVIRELVHWHVSVLRARDTQQETA